MSSNFSLLDEIGNLIGELDGILATDCIDSNINCHQTRLQKGSNVSNSRIQETHRNGREEKQTQRNDDDDKNDDDDDSEQEWESLSLTKSKYNGEYYYNRFGHAKYMQLSTILMKQYKLSVDKKNNKFDAMLKSGRKCELVTSGMNAISTVFHCIILKHLNDNSNNDAYDNVSSTKVDTIDYKHTTINIIYSNELYCDTPRLFKHFQQTYYKNNPSISINLFEIDVTKPDEILLLFKSHSKEFSNDDQVNVLFFETSSNPNGYIFDFSIIPKLRQLTKILYVCMDNTWLTSIICNPFDINIGADIVIISLSKYYSAGQCIGGAILGGNHHNYNSNINTVDLMNIISNYIRINGIHFSPYHCDLIINSIGDQENNKDEKELEQETEKDLDIKNLKDQRLKRTRCVKVHVSMRERIEKTSMITRQCVEWLNNYDKEHNTNVLVGVYHPFLKHHKSHKLHIKYFGDKLGPSVISFKIKLKSSRKVKRWIKTASTKILAKTSFGGKDTRLNNWPEKEHDGTLIRLAIGFNDSFEEIKNELNKMLQKLTLL